MEIVINNLYNNAVITLICYQDAYNQAYLNLETQQKKFYPASLCFLKQSEADSARVKFNINIFY